MAANQANQVIKYIGRTTDFRGKTLWEIVSNLKNFGVGRVVVRSRFERYDERSYMRILKVETLPEPAPSYDVQRKVKVLVQKVFRGHEFEKPIWVSIASYKTDHRLLSKKEEAEYCKTKPIPIKLIAPYMDLPPLLKEFVMKETGNSNPKMKVHMKEKVFTFSRLAKEGETPDVELEMGIGKPHPEGVSLYEGLNVK